MKTTLYGIRNCDTMKKARAWLDGHGVAYDFHDYKVSGIDRAKLDKWAAVVGWETLLNRAGTTFRKLPDSAKAGLTEARAIDLVLAVSEVAANTIKHAKSPGSLKIWYDDSEIVCQIHDEGVITDPLTGHRRPSLEAQGGHGLWIVNQVCDQVELRSDESGTTIRLHMNLPGASPGHDPVS